MAHAMLDDESERQPMRLKKSTPRPVRLTAEAQAAAGRLTEITGLSLEELVELSLLGVDADALACELGAASPPPRTARPPARVIPIQRGRRSAPIMADRRRRVPPPPPAGDLIALRRQAREVRARAEEARRHAGAARERAAALLSLYG